MNISSSILISLIITTCILITFLFGIGKVTKPWDGNFSHDEMPHCYDDPVYNFLNTFWRTKLDPAIDYIPYFNLYDNVECNDYSKPLRGRPIPEIVQCGLTTYRSGTDNVKTLSWAYGPEHNPHFSAGSSKGSNWYAMSKLGKSFYAPTGYMIALFKMKEAGTLRDPHWHSNAAEFSYILKGTARVTVTGVKKTHMNGNPIEFEYSSGGAGSSNRLLNERFSETFLIGPGEAFISPVGYQHYFESVSPDEPLEGIAVFDTADLETFDTPQMMKSIPVEVLGQVLNIPTDEVRCMYRGFRRVFVDAHDGWSLNPPVHEGGQLFKVPAMDRNLTTLPRSEYNGLVSTKVVDRYTNEALAGTHFSFAYTEIDAGATLEPFWIDNSDEIVYVIAGDNIRVIRSGKGKRDCKDEFILHEGYLALLEIGSSWLMINKGLKKAKLLRIFNANHPTMTTLYDAYYSLPDDVKMTMLRPQYYDQYAMYK